MFPSCCWYNKQKKEVPMKSVRIFVLALMLTLLAAGSALAQNINIVNATGFTIEQLGLSHHTASGDAEDLLGEGVLENGYVITINIPTPATWELIAVDGEGGQVNWEGLDLTGVSAITLYGDGSADLE